MKGTIESADLIETGSYSVHVVDITEDNSEYQGKERHQLKWEFEIIDPGEFKGRTIRAWTPQSLAINGQVVAWANALLKTTLTEEDELDTDSLIGKRARAVIVEQEKKTKPGEFFNKVTGLQPLKTMAAKPPTSPTNAVHDTSGIVDDDGGEEVPFVDPFKDK